MEIRRWGGGSMESVTSLGTLLGARRASAASVLRPDAVAKEHRLLISSMGELAQYLDGLLVHPAKHVVLGLVFRQQVGVLPMSHVLKDGRGFDDAYSLRGRNHSPGHLTQSGASLG